MLDPGRSRNPRKSVSPVVPLPRRGAELGPTAGSSMIPQSARFAEDLVLDVVPLVLDVYFLFPMWYLLFPM
jgi:hypothetical protein